MQRQFRKSDPMATTPQANTPSQLPIFYNSIVPLSSEQHTALGLAERQSVPFVAKQHLVPVTIDEFILAQRHMPIVFSTGDNPSPLALFGLHEGENHFVDDDGNWRQGAYVPAYIRRYPFILGRLRPDTNELSLCFDETCEDIDESNPRKLFAGDQPSEITKNILKFCEQFDQSAHRTKAFTEELIKLDLLMDGEVSVQAPGAEKPRVYRGFKMVSEEKLNELRGDQARKLLQNGALPLIYAHMFSVSHIRDLFMRSNPQTDTLSAGDAALTDA